MPGLGSDIRYSIRTLKHAPSFTAVAVLALAAGIGVNTTVFSFYNSVILKPLPANDPKGLVRVSAALKNAPRTSVFSREEAEAFAAAPFSALILNTPAAPVPAVVASGAEPEMILGQFVSDNFFQELGPIAAAGRTLSPGDRTAVVVSHAFSRHRGPEVGKTLEINRALFEIAGITKPDFLGAGAPPLVPDVWIPLAAREVIDPGARAAAQARALHILARLKPGVPAGSAEAALLSIEKAISAGRPDEHPITAFRAAPARLFEGTSGEFETAQTIFTVLMGAVACILLIACANLANMCLARASTRRREIGIRLALGAAPARLVRQLMTESVLLALLGGGCGLLVSIWACDAIWSLVGRWTQGLAGPPATMLLSLSPDLRVFGYTLVVSCAAGMLFGLAPAFAAARANLVPALKQGEQGTGAPPQRAWLRVRLRDLLLAGQVAFGLAFLVAAFLLARSVTRAWSTDPGFVTKNVYILGVRGPKSDAALAARLIARLESIPETQSVAVAMQPPLGGHSSGPIPPETGPQASVRNPQSVFMNIVTPGYFDLLGIPIVRGRSFRESDVRNPVLIVSEATARLNWPGEDPIGKRLRAPKFLDAIFSPGTGDRWAEVIGIAKDVRGTFLSNIDRGYVYFPTSAAAPPDFYVLLLRARSSSKAFRPMVNAALAAIDPGLPARASLISLEDGPLRLQRAMVEGSAAVASSLAFLALLLAAVGVFGQVAYAVSRRTREIGIRMALGAGKPNVIGDTLRRDLKPVAWGASAGLVLAIAAGRLVVYFASAAQGPDLLFGVSPWDPVSILGACAFLGAVAVLAAWIPARRAAGADPVAALRSE